MRKRISVFLIISMLAVYFQTAVFADGEFALSNLVIRQDSQASTIYWVNDEALTDLEIVDNATGDEINVDTASLEKGAVNKITAPLPQSAGELVEYKITCNNKTVLVQSEQVTYSTEQRIVLDSDSWSVTALTNSCVAEMVKSSANKAFHLTRYGTGIVIVEGIPASGYETGKSYQLSFDYKGKNATALSVRLGGASPRIELTDASEWTTKTETFAISSIPSKLVLQVLGTDADVMIDNVCVRLIENGEETGENLIVNGDFESSEAPDALSEINAVGIADGVKFSWDEADCNGYMLWIDGEYTAFLDKSTTSYQITGLEDEVFVTAEVAVKGKNGLISEKTQATAESGLTNVPIPDQSGYTPGDIHIRTDEGKSYMFWRNPSIAPISAEIYRLTDSGDVYIEGTYALGAGSENKAELVGSANDYYKLKLTFADGTVSEQFATVASESNIIYNHWNAYTNINLSRICLTDVNPRSGKYAYKLHRREGTNQHTDLLYRSEVEDHSPGRYKVSYWYRGNLSKIGTNVAYGTGVHIEERIENISPLYNEWKEHVVEFDLTEEFTGVRIRLESLGEIYIDDIAMQKRLDDGNWGENLLENGDFETVTPIEPIKSYTAKAGDGSVELSWELPNDTNCGGVNVYVNDQFKGTFRSGKNSVVIKGLINGRKNDVRIMTVPSCGYPAGSSVEFKVLPKAADYSIDEIVLKKDGVRVNNLSEGTFTVSTNVKNNKASSMNAALVTAVYVDGEMLPLLVDPKSVAQSVLAGTPFSTTFTISAETLAKNPVVKCFVLDSLNSKQALTGKVEFVKAEAQDE